MIRNSFEHNFSIAIKPELEDFEKHSSLDYGIASTKFDIDRDIASKCFNWFVI